MNRRTLYLSLFAAALSAVYAAVLIYAIGWSAHLTPWSYVGRSQLELLVLMTIPHLIAVALSALPVVLAAHWVAARHSIVLSIGLALPVTFFSIWSIATGHASTPGSFLVASVVRDAMILLSLPCALALLLRRLDVPSRESSSQA